MVMVVIQKKFDFTGFKTRFSFPNWKLIKELLVIGIPIGATMFFEVGLFSMTTVLAGRFGSEVVAAHTTAMNIAGITFMLPLAIAMASTIRVGFNVGAGRSDLAQKTAVTALVSTVVIAVLAIILVVLLRYPLAGLYTNNAEVLDLAATLMLFVAFFVLFDHTQVTAIGALRGYKDTRVPMKITFVCYWLIGLPVSCTLGFGWLGDSLGIFGFWIGLITALGIVSFCVCIRLWWVSNQYSAVQV